MIILDENVGNSQRALLLNWKINIRQIGIELGYKGITDNNIISLLHKLNKSIFFTRDDDFYSSKLCHRNYCLVLLRIDKLEAASYIRRILKHPEFDTNDKRIGKVLSIGYNSIKYYSLHDNEEKTVEW